MRVAFPQSIKPEIGFQVVVQNHRYTQLFAVLAALGITIALLLFQFDVFRSKNEWTISTGTRDGDYHAFGESLAGVLNKTKEFKSFESFKEVTSNGSVENLERLENGEAHFAFAQSDSRFGEKVRLIASLYKEVLHVFVRTDSGINTVSDLNNKRVFLGTEGSGTRNLAHKVADHFKLSFIAADVIAETGSEADQRTRINNLKQRILAKLAEKEIDAAFVLAPPGSKEIRGVMDASKTPLKLVGFRRDGANRNPVDGFAVVTQGVRSFELPSFLYGAQPGVPIPTLAVEALLLVSEEVDKAVVHDVTASLFGNRNKIANHLERTLVMRETEDTETSFLPYHDGAKSYYARENPSFFVEYAEVISLMITLLVGLWSIGTLFIKWRAGLRKERIDVYYAELRETSHRQAQDRLALLRQIHEKAFSDLMAERLSADSSFIIFQDYLLSEIRQTERDLERETKDA